MIAIAIDVYKPTFIKSNLLEYFIVVIPIVDVINDNIYTDIASADNCNDNVIIVRKVTVIKKDVLGFKNIDSNIAKNGNGNINTDHVAGNITDNIDINIANDAITNKCLLSKNLGSNDFK